MSRPGPLSRPAADEPPVLPDGAPTAPQDPHASWALAEACRLFDRPYRPGSLSRTTRTFVIAVPRVLARRVDSVVAASGATSHWDHLTATEGARGGPVITEGIFGARTVEIRYGTAVPGFDPIHEQNDALRIRVPAGRYSVVVAPADLTDAEAEVYRALRGPDTTMSPEDVRLVIASLVLPPRT